MNNKGVIRLRGCAGWSEPLLFAYGKNSFSHDVAHIRAYIAEVITLSWSLLCLRPEYEPPHVKINKMTAHSKDKDQPGHPPSLIRVFAVRSIGSEGPKLSSVGQWRLWSDWVDAQADLSLSLGAQSFCWFCHEAAHIITYGIDVKSSNSVFWSTDLMCKKAKVVLGRAILWNHHNLTGDGHTTHNLVCDWSNFSLLQTKHGVQ